MEILLTIVGLSIVIIVHEFGHFIAAKMCGVTVHEFGLGFPPKLFSKEYKGTKYSFNLLPLGGFVRLKGEDELPDATEKQRVPEKGSFAAQTLLKRIFILCAGVFMNIILGFIVSSFIFMVGIPERVIVAGVSPMSPAAEAGIMNGDVVTTLKYKEGILESPSDVNDVIQFVRDTNGEEFAFSVARGEGSLDFRLRGRTNPPPGQGSLGVSLVKVGFPAYSFFESIAESAVQTIQTVKAIVQQFGSLIVNIFVDRSALSQVTGPVGIFQIAIQTSALGFLYFVHFLGFISLNLAVFNLIPFPALDGGRVLLIVFEKLFGPRFGQRFQVTAHVVGFVLLIGLMIVVTFRDISRFF